MFVVCAQNVCVIYALQLRTAISLSFMIFIGGKRQS